VERKASSSDAGGGSASGAETWTPVASVESKAPEGTSSRALRYEAADTDLPFEATALTYRLVQIDRDGSRTVAAEKTVELGTPASFQLHGVAPNPVRTQATIRYDVPGEKDVTIEVFDALGRKVRTLVDGEAQKGAQTARFEAGSLSSGVYVYRIRAGEEVESRKLVLVR